MSTKLKFSDESKKLIFEDRSPKLIFADESKKLIFDITQVAEVIPEPDLIPRNGLVAEYLFSGNADDTSGNNYHGTVNGATLTTDRNSNSNSAYSFNGSSNYININAALAGLATNTKGTWSIWVKPTDVSISMIFLSFSDTVKDSRLWLQIIFSGKLLAFYRKIGSTKWRLDSDNIVFVNNTWVHIAIVQDAIEPIIYVDGIAVDQTFIVSTDKTLWFNDNALIDNGRIGDYNYNNFGENTFFKGDLDDIRIYNRDLSQAEITILANE